MRKLLLYSIFLLLGIKGFSQQFTSGNIAVLVTASATANNTTASIIELNTTTAGQSAVTTHTIDGTTAGIALRFSGSATSTGYMANTNDGTLLCFTAHNTTTASGNINVIAPRGVGSYDQAGTFNLATTYTGVTSGQQTRCATSLDNSTWYIADQNGMYTNGATSPSPSGNFRGVKSFGAVVYIASSSVINTISAPTGGTVVALPGLAAFTNLQDFYLVQSGSNGNTFDILYTVTNSTGSSNTAGTISKFSLVSGSWIANGTYTTLFGGFGLAAKKNGSGADLFVSSGAGALAANSVIKLNDAAGFNSTINITTGNNVTLYAAAAGTVVKGVAFTPVANASPSLSPSPSTVNFSNTITGSFSASQTITLTASNLTPASGSLTVTVPNANFQVANDGMSWNSTAIVAYSSSGATTGNFQIRFSPQSSGLQSGNVTITGGGLSVPVNVVVSGTGTNPLSLNFSPSNTVLLNPPYISAVISDPTDPGQQQGIITDVKENGAGIHAVNYTLSASSSNTTVVPNANITITKADGQATIKIAPAAVGYSDITLTLSKDGNNTTLVIKYAASSSSAAGTRWHTSMADASGAIAIDDTYMIICDDEKNQFSVYNRSQSGLPVKTYDFNQANILGLTDGSVGNWKEVDVEAGVRSTSIAGRIYWLGSMSNSSSFNDKPNRNRLFAVSVTGTGASTAFTDAGHYSNLRQRLITWGDANGYNFSTSAADGHDPKVIDGFNIEGMVFGPDNTTMYIGFRAPLVPTVNRTKAVIAPIQNFESWFNNGSPVSNPTIGSPIELDLNGRGIRDIIRLSNGTYIIIAGSYDEAQVAAVYQWTGNTSDAPQLTTFNVSGLNLEAVLQVNESGVISPSKLQVIADDGNKIYYGDGIAAKDLSQDNFKKFSSNIALSSGVLPVTFIYFNANRQNNNVLLQWEVAQSYDLKTFEILRSTNGRDFVSLTNINVMPGRNSYSYSDNNISGGRFYYRIKAKEINNNEYTSVVRLVNLQASTGSVMIYPNPVINRHFTISINQPGNKFIRIYSANGELYKEFRFTEEIKDIDTNLWARGNYFIQIVTNNGISKTERLVLQ